MVNSKEDNFFVFRDGEVILKSQVSRATTQKVYFEFRLNDWVCNISYSFIILVWSQSNNEIDDWLRKLTRSFKDYFFNGSKGTFQRKRINDCNLSTIMEFIQ